MSRQTNIHIRIPQAGDGEGLARTWLDAANYYAKLNPELFQIPDTNGLVQWCENWITPTPSGNGFFRVAEHTNQVIGFISATIHSRAEDGRYQLVRDLNLLRLFVDAIVVQKSYWRHGIGRRLLHLAEEWGQGQGAAITLLDTYIDSPVSVSFYEQRMGYRRRALHFRKVLV